MRKYLAVLFVAFTICGSVCAQQKSVFLELAGSGGLGSVNYEFLKLPAPVKSHGMDDQPEPKSWSRGMRLGLSFTPVDKNNGIVIIAPVMAAVIYQKYQSAHGLEFSAGLAPSITTKGSWYIKSPLALGYRFQPMEKKLFFRVTYTPIIGWLLDYNWQHWAGISIGYKLT